MGSRLAALEPYPEQHQRVDVKEENDSLPSNEQNDYLQSRTLFCDLVIHLILLYVRPRERNI